MQMGGSTTRPFSLRTDRPSLKGLFDLQIIIAALPIHERVGPIDPAVSGLTQAGGTFVWIFVRDVADTGSDDHIFREVVGDFHIDQDFAAQLLLDQAFGIDRAGWAFEDADRLRGQAIGCGIFTPVIGPQHACEFANAVIDGEV